MSLRATQTPSSWTSMVEGVRKSNKALAEPHHVMGAHYPDVPNRDPVSRHDMEVEHPYGKLFSMDPRDHDEKYSSGFSAHHSGGHIVPSGEAMFGNRYVSKLKTQQELWKNDTERAIDNYNTTEDLRKSAPLNVSAHLEQVIVNGRRAPIYGTVQTKVSNLHHY